MTNLRAIYLILGIVMVALIVVAFAIDITPPGLLLVSPFILIGASVYYTIKERSRPSKKQLQQREQLLQNIRSSWTRITVSANDCEVKSSTYFREVGNPDIASGYANLVIAPQLGALWDAAKYDDDRMGTETLSQTVIIAKANVNGQTKKLISHLITKDQTTVLFQLHSLGHIEVYVNPANPAECFFDVFLE